MDDSETYVQVHAHAMHTSPSDAYIYTVIWELGRIYIWWVLKQFNYFQCCQMSMLVKIRSLSN